jgi:hypothetical protein
VKTGAIPFVQARIDPLIESNPALDDEFSSVDNRLHKQSKRGANLYIAARTFFASFRRFLLILKFGMSATAWWT